jgi:predicted transposase/invertase (TIGR01784 family)
MTNKKTTLHHPHDSVFKKALSDVKVARDLLRQHLPKDLQALIDWKSLHPETTSYIDDDLKTSSSDILYQLNTKEGHLYCLIEHQSQPDHYMALRLLEYTLRIFRNHLKKGHKTLPLVIHLVIYNGKKPYPKSYPRDLMELFKSPSLAKQWMFQPFKLVDLSIIDDNTLMQTPWASLLQMVMKHVYDRDIEHTLGKLLDANILQTILAKQGQDYLKTMLYYVYNTGEIKHKERLVQMMDQADPNLGAFNMTIAEQWRQEGIQQGIQLGKQEGIQLGKQEGIQQGEMKTLLTMAKKLLARQTSISEVAELTDLSIKEILALQKKTKH